MTNFAIVEFINETVDGENEIEVVPRTWLLREDCCWWPSTKGQKLQRMLTDENSVPDLRPGMGILYKSKILKYYESYTAAKQKLDIAENTSCLETESDNESMKSRKIRKKKALNDFVTLSKKSALQNQDNDSDDNESLSLLESISLERINPVAKPKKKTESLLVTSDKGRSVPFFNLPSGRMEQIKSLAPNSRNITSLSLTFDANSSSVPYSNAASSRPAEFRKDPASSHLTDSLTFTSDCLPRNPLPSTSVKLRKNPAPSHFKDMTNSLRFTSEDMPHLNPLPSTSVKSPGAESACTCHEKVLAEIRQMRDEQSRFQEVVLQKLLKLEEGVCDRLRVMGAKNCAPPVLDLPSFPMMNFEDVNSVENWLRSNLDNIQILMQHFSTFGGACPKDTTRRILRRILTSSISYSINWTGKNGKFALMETRLAKVITASVRLSFPEVTEKEIEDTIKSWFRFAKDRDGGREKRRNNANTSV